MNQHIVEETTESRFFAEYDRTKADLGEAQQEVLLLTEHLRTANIENEQLSYKCDFLTREVARIMASREQFERIAVRLSGMMDGALDSWIALAERMKNEVREAAFTKVMPAQTPVPETPPPPPEPPAEQPAEPEVDAEQIGKTFGVGFAESVLPVPRFGSGPRS